MIYKPLTPRGALAILLGLLGLLGVAALIWSLCAVSLNE